MKKFIILSLILVCLPNFLFAEILSFRNYKVQKNDTLFGIGKKFAVTTQEIYRWNAAKKKNPRLFVGEILRIPIFASINNSKASTQTAHSQSNSDHGSSSDTGLFRYPLNQYRPIVQNFSPVSYIPHKGILFQNKKISDSVIASRGGKVVAIDYMDGYGNYVILQHYGGYYSVYGNLGKVMVGEGQAISQGELVGSTEIKKGLYFQINLREKAIDPLPYIRKG
ncbi:LIC_10271 family cell wall hydrolase [Leptospira sp. GIMC2001]|uniref:LIC_10271 family cell wall hydrolase n=1 Tax=Leptospira sp. GIMC2001 TaxID=1513297 RepID=UPI00234B75F5|nr:M23 family metallopeptidase [Leptospira sp. GIMC2001]WCL50550.1 LysM peptidoglycan-binding domain-containing M23 family metallopeptidase [Leptospira sp. GIMC2001]